jgi:short chain dehydrogenase
MQLRDKTVLVTGANRRLGRALDDEALGRGAKRIYAASRQPMVVPDERVTPLILDVTDPAQIQDVADRVESLDILINNAGVSVADDLTDRSAFEWHLAVNLYGTLDVTQAFLPALTRSRGPIDTDMVRALDIPKTPPGDVARATLDGVERGEEEIFPDPMAQSLADGWRTGVAKQFERQNAAMVHAEPNAA